MRAPGRTSIRAAAALVCLAAVAGSGPVLPADGDEPETIRVEGRRDAGDPDPTGSVTVLRADAFASRIASLAELLAEASGLQVRSLGGLGAFATVSIRGSTAEQVNIYLDGVLLNPAPGGGVNLADLSLAGIDSIEIYRGFTPAWLSTGAIGGAIHIRTRRPAPGGAQASGSLGYGSWHTAEATVAASWGGERSGGVVTFDGARSEGDFRFWNDNGTDFQPEDDGWETRLNNEFWRGELSARTEIAPAPESRFAMDVSLARRRQGVPGIDAFQSQTARAEMTRGLVKAGYERDALAGGTLSLALDAHYSVTLNEFADEAGDTAPGGVPADAENLADAAGPSLLLRWHPRRKDGPSHFASLLLSGRMETAERTDHLNQVPARGEARRLGYTVSLQDEVHFAGGRLVVTPSVRWERFTSDFEAAPGVTEIPAADAADAGLTGRLGAAWRPAPALLLRASAGRFYRVPGFIEIFGDQGSVKGGEDLVPEEGINYEVGAAWKTGPHGQLKRLELETSLFRSDAENLIQFVQTSQSHVVARNTRRARIQGAELSAGLDLFDWFSGALNYTYQRAQDLNTFTRGSDLPGRPRHEASARATARRAWGRLFYEFDYVGPNWVDTAAAVVGGASGAGRPRDLYRIPGRYFHDAGLTLFAGARLELTAEVDNIFNVRTVDVARYPLPGRTALLKLRLRLP
ncbi:MAG TPA: TonB-dependent receptor [Candidatus Polarisedimenticolia bacterium]|nr:TonB-dependent receptor [Candidatus Polarisedimenticolia bacterium]